MTATEKQVNFINSLLNKKQMDAKTEHMVAELTENGYDSLSSKNASAIINSLLACPDKKSIQYYIAVAKAQDERLDKYEKLIQWAKDNGLSVRKMMKKSTVIEKINQAGLSIPVELR